MACGPKGCPGPRGLPPRPASPALQRLVRACTRACTAPAAVALQHWGYAGEPCWQGKVEKGINGQVVADRVESLPVV